MRRLRFGVLSEDGDVYNVGRYKDGRKRYDGALWLALREARLLRRDEPNAKVVRIQSRRSLATTDNGGTN